MDGIPYIPVVITKYEEDHGIGISPMVFRPYMAQVISNPKLRADGETREEALERLKFVLKSNFGGHNPSGFEIVNMDLNEILVEEVMKT